MNTPSYNPCSDAFYNILFNSKVEELQASLAAVNLCSPSALAAPVLGEKLRASCVCVKFPTRGALQQHLIVGLHANDSAFTSQWLKANMPACVVNSQSSNTLISQRMEYLWPWLWKQKSERERWEDAVWKEEGKGQQWQWGNPAFAIQVIH